MHVKCRGARGSGPEQSDRENLKEDGVSAAKEVKLLLLGKSWGLSGRFATSALNKDAAGVEVCVWCVVVCGVGSTDTACISAGARGVGEEHHRQTDEVSAGF